LALPPFTEKQGQYLAFIYAYGRIFRRPPAEADLRLAIAGIKPMDADPRFFVRTASGSTGKDQDAR
jgi:hypothetical protein